MRQHSQPQTTTRAAARGQNTPGEASPKPALITPCTPVSWMHRSTSLRCWMLPLANTGMFTACLQRKKTPKIRDGFFSGRQQIKHYESLQDNQNLKLFNHCCFCVMFLLSMHLIEDAISSCTWCDEDTGNSSYRTALMCSQLAMPVMAPFCSLVLPCTVSSWAETEQRRV